MANILQRIWKEHVAEISIVLLIIGLMTLIFGILGIIWTENLIDTLGISQDLLSWSVYILIVGVILTLAGTFYFYDFMRNKRFLLSELETKKRSEFLKNHAEIKNAVRHLPTKYQDMLTEKEKELRIK
ncbi:MAG: hypothetical protein KGY50_02270 [Candidatus Thermoplasmatota archaeon]|nr:hypothetical protein [Candidatus Thermoplasmatota archaeon]